MKTPVLAWLTSNGLEEPFFDKMWAYSPTATMILLVVAFVIYVVIRRIRAYDRNDREHATMKLSIDQLNISVNKIDQRVDKLDQRVDKLDQKVDRLEIKFDQKFAELDKKIDLVFTHLVRKKKRKK